MSREHCIIHHYAAFTTSCACCSVTRRCRARTLHSDSAVLLFSLSLSFRRADNNSSTPHGSCCCSVENRRTVRSRTACETHLSFGHLAACPCCRLCLHSSLRCSSSAATQLSIGRLLQRLTAYRTSAISSFLRLFLQIINSNLQQLLAFSSCSSGLSIPDGALLLFFFSSFRRPLSFLSFGPQSHFVLVGPIRFLSLTPSLFVLGGMARALTSVPLAYSRSDSLVFFILPPLLFDER